MRPIAAAGIGCAVLAVAGCGGDSPTVKASDSAVQVEISNTINYGSTGTTTTLDCADGKSLTIGGSNNTVTVTGRCASVNVGGADNKVTLDAVSGDITTVGLNNSVVYRDGEPTINDVGTDNSITKG
ncbi:DUF3060 domain-containing protein [Mycolicibacterium arenosum]|uniref:DUF3060 domain-containing protein n=1 Tax=Mycolicibacterium arenosum TaxID=2952157 RepID=A0ABT1M948_9MYCO|nr:DUF3060 domain-containing protein [Mycolicibacterium sp. CAU 1645]MCP9275347.1 DUF3060 domain-containing protein [Mycolicibacterium sp. CAU 1645]